jgi:hypothetical protein
MVRDTKKLRLLGFEHELLNQHRIRIRNILSGVSAESFQVAAPGIDLLDVSTTAPSNPVEALLSVFGNRSEGEETFAGKLFSLPIVQALLQKFFSPFFGKASLKLSTFSLGVIPCDALIRSASIFRNLGRRHILLDVGYIPGVPRGENGTCGQAPIRPDGIDTGNGCR